MKKSIRYYVILLIGMVILGFISCRSSKKSISISEKEYNESNKEYWRLKSQKVLENKEVIDPKLKRKQEKDRKKN